MSLSYTKAVVGISKLYFLRPFTQKKSHSKRQYVN